MADSIMDSTLAMVTPEMRQSLARRLSESPQSVQGGLGAGAAATLEGLASKVDDHRFLAQVLNLTNGAAGQNVSADLSAIVSDAPAEATADLVNRFLPTVFGPHQGQVADAIAQQWRLSASSSARLLPIAVALILAVFGKLQRTRALDARTLAELLRGEAPNLRRYLPSGLLGSAAGIVRVSASGAFAGLRADNVADAATPPRWMVPAAITVTLLLVWLVFRSATAPDATARVTNTAASVGDTASGAATAAWAALGAMMKLRLPDGSELMVPSRGLEARLVRFLNDRSAPASENSWFDFDRLLFDAGKATLQPASYEQLGNIAAILRAYPQVRVRIGGYGDNLGDPAANVRLSEERANNVMDELVRFGIDPTRISAADNSTAAGRQKNRRISLRVTDKRSSV